MHSDAKGDPLDIEKILKKVEEKTDYAEVRYEKSLTNT